MISLASLCRSVINKKYYHLLYWPQTWRPRRAQVFITYSFAYEVTYAYTLPIKTAVVAKMMKDLLNISWYLIWKKIIREGGVDKMKIKRVCDDWARDVKDMQRARWWEEGKKTRWQGGGKSEKEEVKELVRYFFTDVGFPSWQNPLNLECSKWLAMYCGCLYLLICFTTPGICTFWKKPNVPFCPRLYSHLPSGLPECLVMRRELRYAKRK